MKKILFSTITFLSLVALASCGEKDKTTSTSGTIYDTTTFVPTTTVDTTTANTTTVATTTVDTTTVNTTTLETTTIDESTTVDTTTGNTTTLETTTANTTTGNITSATTTGDTTSVTTTGNTTSVTTPGNTTSVTTPGNTTSVTTTGNTTSVTTTGNTTSVTTTGDTTSVTTTGNTTSVTTTGNTTSVTTTGDTTSVTTTSNTDTTTTSSQTTIPIVVDYGSISGNSYEITLIQETYSEKVAPIFEPYIGSVITFREDGIFEWTVENYPYVGEINAIGNWYQKDDGSFTYIQHGVIQSGKYIEMPEELQVERAIDLTEEGILIHSYYNASETDYGDLHLEAVLTEKTPKTYSYWEKTTYDEIKSSYQTKQDLLWDKVNITFESYNDDMVSHVGTFELTNEVWTLTQHNDEFDWTRYYPSTYLPNESYINELENTPSYVTMTYEKFRNHYRITAYADIPEQNRVVTTIIEMDEYFAVTYQTQIVNGQTVMKALNTWSTKEE